MSGNTVETGFEFRYKVIDLAVDSTPVSTRRAILRAAYINTITSGATIIKDGTTTVFTIPSGVGAGQLIPFGDVVFDSGIVVDPDDAGTGNITVIYKPVL